MFSKQYNAVLYESTGRAIAVTMVSFSVLVFLFALTILHSKRPKLYTILISLSAVGLKYCVVGKVLQGGLSYMGAGLIVYM